jgi:hypothetical protein
MKRLWIAGGLVVSLAVAGTAAFALGLDFNSEGAADQLTHDDRVVDGIIQNIDQQERSEFQAGLLLDGTLTEDEYDLAFTKFADCATQAGVVLDGDRTKNQWGVYDAGYTIPPISYGVPNAAAREAAERCNTEYFDVVGQRWQAAHMVPREAIDAEFAKIPDCMRAKGLEPPADLSPHWSTRYQQAHSLEEGMLLEECIREANRNLGMPKSVGIAP